MFSEREQRARRRLTELVQTAAQAPRADDSGARRVVMYALVGLVGLGLLAFALAVLAG